MSETEAARLAYSPMHMRPFLPGAKRGSSPSEATLIEAIRDGDADAAAELVRAYWTDAYRVAFLLIHDHGAAEELAQDALLAGIRSIETFDPNRPFLPWLERIAANGAYDRLRRDHRRPTLVSEAGAASASTDDSIADELAHDALPEALVAALAALDVDHRTAVVLRHLLDYEPREIAEMTGVPAATVRTRIHRGLARLRVALLTEKGEVRDERAG